MTIAADQPLRVLHICPNYERLLDLFGLYRDALDRPPFESTVLFLRGKPDAAVKARFNGRVHFLDLSRRSLRGPRLLALWRLWRLCWHQRFDVFVAHRYKALALALMLRRLGAARQVIGVVHEIGQFGGWRRRMIERARGTSLTLIGVSEAVFADLVARLPLFPAAGLHALPNAVSDWPTLLRPVARAELGLEEERFWFGCVGRLVPVKGHAILLHAFAQLAADHPAAGLALVGSGRLEDELRRLAATLGIAGQVVFCGWRDDVRRLLCAFDVCVFPSLEEGFGLAIAEAMAAGRPVIASAVGGVPQVVGVQGVQVAAGDVPALAAAMRDLIGDAALRDAMGLALRARWEQEFSPPRFDTRLRQLVQKTVQPEHSA